MTQRHTIGSTSTSIFTEDGITRVVYHSTPVVSFTQDKIVLDTGGWKTATTKTRMNQASSQFELGYTVRQRNGEWSVLYKGKFIPFDEQKLVLERGNK